MTYARTHTHTHTHIHTYIQKERKRERERERKKTKLQIQRLVFNSPVVLLWFLSRRTHLHLLYYSQGFPRHNGDFDPALAYIQEHGGIDVGNSNGFGLANPAENHTPILSNDFSPNSACVNCILCILVSFFMGWTVGVLGRRRSSYSGKIQKCGGKKKKWWK